MSLALLSGAGVVWGIVVAIVLLALAGAGVLYYFLRKKSAAEKAESRTVKRDKPVVKAKPVEEKKPNNTAVKTVPAVEETPAEAVAVAELTVTDAYDEDEEAESVAAEEEEDTEIVREVDEKTGLAIIVRYKKSFSAKLIQSSDVTKSYYAQIKNSLLSYKKVKSRVSWSFDSFHFGRQKLAKLVMRGKTLCLYLALNAEDYADTRFKVEKSQSKKFEEISCLYRIKNARRARYAAELIAALSEKFAIEGGEQQAVDYYVPYETTEALVEKGLIKELISEEKYEEFMRRRSMKVVDKNRRQFISAAEVNSIIKDEVAIALVETEPKIKSGAAVKKRYRKKTIVNVDELSAAFAADDVVNLHSLKEKGLVGKDADFVKVLARGVLDKPLAVEAQDFSVEAIKMILLTGGRAKKVL